MKLIRAVVRFILLLFHVLLGVLLTLWYAFVLRQSFADDRYRKTIRWWLGRVVRILGGNVTVRGEPATTGTLLVSNHVSWLDIPLLGSISSIRFLSKDEVRYWPVIGTLANKAGTLYIRRGYKGAAQQVAEVISERLADGDAVLIFPEGTTSDGTDILHFHARLFTSASAVAAPVQPIAIRYSNARGELSDKVPYTGNVSLLANLMGLLSEPALYIEVNYLPLLSSTEQPRRVLARKSEEQIRTTLWGTADPGQPDQQQPGLDYPTLSGQ